MRAIRCDKQRFVYVFFSGLEATFSGRSAATCAVLRDDLAKALRVTPNGVAIAEIEWWTQSPPGHEAEAIGCSGNGTKRTRE